MIGQTVRGDGFASVYNPGTFRRRELWAHFARYCGLRGRR